MRYIFIILILLNIIEAKTVITPYISKQLTNPPNKDLQDNEAIYGIGIRGYLNKYYAIDMRIEGSNGNLMGDGGRTDIERGSVNFFYDILPNKKISPYLYGGIGYEQLHRRYFDVKSQPFVNAGIGVKTKINETLEVVAEAKYLKKTKSKDSEVIGNLGVGYIFYDKLTMEKENTKKLKKKVENNIPQVFLDKNESIELLKKVKCDNNENLFYDEVDLAQNTQKIKNTHNQENLSKSNNYIQIAVLTKKRNLKNCLKVLKSKGYKVKVVKKHKTSTVYVGPYAKNKIKKIYHEVKKIYKDAFYTKI